VNEEALAHWGAFAPKKKEEGNMQFCLCQVRYFIKMEVLGVWYATGVIRRIPMKCQL
jgi:hypothetical protein